MLTDVTESLIDTARNATSDDELRAAAQAFFDAAAGAPEHDVEAAMRKLAENFDHRELPRAGYLAVGCGALVERGHDPSVIAEPLTRELARLLHASAELADACRTRIVETTDDGEGDDAPDEEERFEEARLQLASAYPRQDEAWEALYGFWPAAVAVFSASVEARAAARPLRQPAARIADYHEAGFWLQALLGVPHEAPIVVLEPQTRRGLLARMSGVVDVFQLHVLLMDAFPSSGGLPPRRIPAHVVDVVRGEGPQQTQDTVAGAWNLYSWQAVRPGRALPDAEDDEASRFWIWNEMAAEDIPELQGRRAILLGPPSYLRTWQAQRTFSALRAGLSIERTLSPGEVDEWLDRMAAAAAQEA